MDKTQVIEQAKAHFAKLLSDQLDRAESLENAAAPKDYTRLDKIVVGLCPGDGIGPIIMRETRRVLEKLLAGISRLIRWIFAPFGRFFRKIPPFLAGKMPKKRKI